MKFKDWKSYYDDIASDLELDKPLDEIAAEIFDRLIERYSHYYVPAEKLNTLIEGKSIYIFGAAPSLEHDIIKNKKNFLNNIVITSDGATTAFLKYDIIPDVIVTDLDGVIADQIYANKKGAILIIHAHADNVSVIQQTLPKITGSFHGTIQTNPFHHRYVKNYGGFTDGDRAVFIADHFHPKQIYLGGFDCAAKPGFYSFQSQKNSSKKRKKLEWCDRLLQRFPRNYLKHL